MIRICYIPHGREYSTYIKQIAKHLKKQGIEFVFVANGKTAVAQYREDGFESCYIGEIFQGKRVFPPQELLELDLRYGPYGINAICNSDLYMPFLYKRQEDREQMVARAYVFWENFFTKNKIDYILTSDTSSFDTRSAYNVARRRGDIPLGIIYPGPRSDYFLVCDVGEEFCWSEFLDALSEGSRPLTREQKRVTLEFIEERIKGNHATPNFKSKFMTDSIFSILRETVGMWKMGIDEARNNDPVGVAGAKVKFRKLLKRYWWRYFTQIFFHYDKVKQERYAYFPIFYGNEIANKSNYHYWTQNQLSMIKEIAESLPAGIKLYVKEHPGQPGNSSYRWLKKVRSIPSIKVIHPLINGQHLIDNCEAVVVLNGTSGWEAYLSRKPVVMLASQIYFSRSRLIYKVGSPCELPGAMFKAIKEGSSIYEKNEEEWLWFIYCIISTANRGTFYGGVIDDPRENCKKMAKYIGKKIRKSVHEL
jgi:hypothetical protein